MLSRYYLRFCQLSAIKEYNTPFIKNINPDIKKMNERIQQIFIKQDESEITNTGQLLNSASTLVEWRCLVLHHRQPL